MDINAEFSGRNDLLINGCKFSGNAQYNYKNKVMHHSTLLFSSQISDISNALKVSTPKIDTSKTWESVKKGVDLFKELSERIDKVKSNLDVIINLEI